MTWPPCEKWFFKLIIQQLRQKQIKNRVLPLYIKKSENLMSYIFHSFNIWHKRRRQRFLPHFLFFFFRYIFFSYYRFHETDEYVYRVEDSAGRPCTGDQARTPQHKAIIDDLVFRRHAKIVCVLEARWHSCDFTKIKSSKFYSTKIWKIGGTLWRTELSILRALKCCWKWSFTSYITSRVNFPSGTMPSRSPLNLRCYQPLLHREDKQEKLLVNRIFSLNVGNYLFIINTLTYSLRCFCLFFWKSNFIS